VQRTICVVDPVPTVAELVTPPDQFFVPGAATRWGLYKKEIDGQTCGAVQAQSGFT